MDGSDIYRRGRPKADAASRDALIAAIEASERPEAGRINNPHQFYVDQRWDGDDPAKGRVTLTWGQAPNLKGLIILPWEAHELSRLLKQAALRCDLASMEADLAEADKDAGAAQ